MGFEGFFPWEKSGEICFFPLETTKSTFFSEIFKIRWGQGPSLPPFRRGTRPLPAPLPTHRFLNEAVKIWIVCFVRISCWKDLQVWNVRSLNINFNFLFTHLERQNSLKYEQHDHRQQTPVLWPFLPISRSKHERNRFVNCIAIWLMFQHRIINKSNASGLRFLRLTWHSFCTNCLCSLPTWMKNLKIFWQFKNTNNLPNPLFDHVT